MIELTSTDQLDLRSYLQAGDGIMWGQALAEPSGLLERLSEQLPELPPLKGFVGIPGDATANLSGRMALTSYCGIGTNSEAIKNGDLDLLPVHYSSLPSLIESGQIDVDVLFLQLSAPDEKGRFSLGLARDALRSGLHRARLVIAEVHADVPWTYGGPHLTETDIDIAVPAVGPLREVQATSLAPAQQEVASRVAELVDDRATIAVGIGAIPDAVIGRLMDRRDLGIHSGVIGDAVAKLIEAGVITGAYKSAARGVAVASALLGTRYLFEYAHRNPQVELRDATYTHNPHVIASQDDFVAITSGLQVDLFGQVNSESIGPRYVGTVGGAVDFLRGAARSRGGLPIVALPSRAGDQSRIVGQLAGPVSVARTDPVIVVTEYGVADLRGKTVRQRTKALIEVAAPEARARLQATAGRMRGNPASESRLMSGQ